MKKGKTTSCKHGKEYGKGKKGKYVEIEIKMGGDSKQAKRKKIK